MDFRPDIVILKSYVNLNLRNILKCPIVFLVPGIFNDNLNKDYSKLFIKKDYEKQMKENTNAMNGAAPQQQSSKKESVASESKD